MKNKSEILVGYRPRVSFYPKTHASGRVDFYVTYYLPGVKKKVARPLHCKKSEARELMFIHERRLRNHQFDDFDLQRIPEIYQLELNAPRVQIMDALERYMIATSYNRRPSTNRNTYGVLRNFSEKLKVQFIDEVTTEKIQRLIGQMKSEGNSEATVFSYLGLMESFFNWLIRDAQVFDQSNPVSKVRKPPRSCKVSKRQVDKDTIAKLLQVADLPSNIRVPIISMIRFILITGCRKGEAIHAEWGDFDLDQGIWRIRDKPECPTILSEGWKPKANKERDVYLLPEAVDLVNKLSRQEETWGSVKINGKLTFKRADFVFTVKRRVKIDGVSEWRQTRIGNERSSWKKLLEEAGIPDLQIKDLRRFLNSVLVNDCGLSHKEAGVQIGNSNLVNYNHYTQVDLEAIKTKLEKHQDLLPQFLN